MNKTIASQETSGIIISSTLYRALFLLQLLSAKEMSIPEIKQALSENKNIGPKISEDTIRMTMSTLKAVGCVFSKPSIKNNFRYKIIKSPFKYTLSEKEIDFLEEMREQIASFVSWQNLLKINNFYERINNYMNDTENKFALSKQSIFLNVDLELLEELEQLCKQKSYISILYSSKNVLKNINIVPYFIRYENEYVYLWCYSEEHKGFSFLRVDRIKKINNLLPEKKLPKIETSKIVLRVEKIWLDIFKLKYNTKIIETLDEYYVIEVEYMNEFHIIQTVLEIAPYCKVLEPVEMREKVVAELEKMRKLYTV